MSECRRPIEAWEIPYLQALGADIRCLREEAGLSRRIVAYCAQISQRQLERIEKAERRTRRSTLELIVAVFTDAYGYDDKTAAELLDHLVNVAGPALAEESEYAERVIRRRTRRVAKKERQLELAAQLARPLAQQIGREYASDYIRRWRWLHANPGYRRSW